MWCGAEHEAGDTIGTHSMTHPSRFQRLSGDKLAYQIDGGIAAGQRRARRPK